MLRAIEINSWIVTEIEKNTYEGCNRKIINKNIEDYRACLREWRVVLFNKNARRISM